ncbi:MAG: HAD-IIB family hydrolase [Spirochaetales bacterium]|nr:HAD-IIB family hydrolase [Spirochaetales bacterium]
MKEHIQLLSFDLDGTLTGNPDATLRFRKTWEGLEEEKRPLLCYNSGRLLKSTLELIDFSDLPAPDYCICGVGTLIYDYKKDSQIKEFLSTLTTGWDLGKVREILNTFEDIKEQPAKFQDRFKSSWFLYDASLEKIKEVNSELTKAGLKVNLVYSSSRDLDILPVYANKGNALKWLIDQIGIEAESVIVGGDTGNDSSMFLIPGIKGIVVENAQPELYAATIKVPTYIAKQTIADGILEGLLHYGVICKIADTRTHDIGHRRFAPTIRAVLKAETFNGLDDEQADFVRLAYGKAVDALKKNITPMGFSACSLSDNSFKNTDENYRSIWGRDGSITVINSLSITDDEEIQICQLQTLVTLLDNVSASGQVPSNVRIDDSSPDYSGVGGICSIDSGLWLIIAVYNYIRAKRDYDFLRRYAGVIRKIMSWLWAHDSNSDYLIEVPEAGDWTDLFGRSYNVLYDEVLWYYCNLCAGRIEELLGSYTEAEGYLRNAQIIREVINRNFWPSINSENLKNFSEQQYSLGEAQYLIAEITPFGFDWRCDVFGNILAGLFNVISIERARTAFGFMWGVGINEPAPVNNLYPPVNAGDPGWRPYYTVNLLNLPHHYHNGGVWPFIGGYWVQFVNSLGMRDLAQRELYRLAKINEAGIRNEWEFNEWMHGKTGRPMGKAFQAWSASGFISAYDSLQK